MGDFNGIGPEVTLKSVVSKKVRSLCTPVLVGSIDVYEFYAKQLAMEITLREVQRIGDVSPTSGNTVQVVNAPTFVRPRTRPGKRSAEAGMFAIEALRCAVTTCLDGNAAAVVTAPVSKDVLALSGHPVPGQTEFIARLCSVKHPLMILAADSFRVGLATIHVPLRNVARSISTELLLEKLVTFSKALRKDFSIKSPKIAVLGLNPHAGEYALLGREEIDAIVPAIRKARRRGVSVEGAFAADGFFGSGQFKKFDGVLAMYHDQGLIPLKLLGFDTGVNVTAGLPIVRTSPDHGTAFDIAGKGCANPSSMIEAIRLAVEITRNRKGGAMNILRRSLA